jgi:hypothetical protein
LSRLETSNPLRSAPAVPPDLVPFSAPTSNPSPNNQHR